MTDLFRINGVMRKIGFLGFGLGLVDCFDIEFGLI